MNMQIYNQIYNFFVRLISVCLSKHVQSLKVWAISNELAKYNNKFHVRLLINLFVYDVITDYHTHLHTKTPPKKYLYIHTCRGTIFINVKGHYRCKCKLVLPFVESLEVEPRNFMIRPYACI